MAMVCPQCGSAYEQRLQCPLCGVRLLYRDLRRHQRSSFASAPWQQTPWGRILIGLFLAQGLFYGLRHLLTALLLTSQGEEGAQLIWASASGFFLLQGVRIFSLLAGAVLAGGGQRHGWVVGAVAGSWNGVLSVLWLPGPAQSLTTIAVLGQPLLQATVGAFGGWLGAVIWKPLPAEPAEEATAPAKKAGRARRPLNLWAGPVAWYRVSAGIVLAVAGTLSATIFFEKILDLSHGALATTDEVQDYLIIMEIKALAVFLGGALAGATTANGFKQGFCVGLGTVAILIGIEMNFVQNWLQVAALTTVSAFCLSVVGGWFGGQLFPPIIKARRERGVGEYVY
jgi:hypothetical protein